MWDQAVGSFSSFSCLALEKGMLRWIVSSSSLSLVSFKWAGLFKLVIDLEQLQPLTFFNSFFSIYFERIVLANSTATLPA